MEDFTFFCADLYFPPYAFLRGLWFVGEKKKGVGKCSNQTL
jgi:hypothetical protein